MWLTFCFRYLLFDFLCTTTMLSTYVRKHAFQYKKKDKKISVRESNQISDHVKQRQTGMFYL